ncbi:MAG TPA: CPBP family intramembrane metalloprotease [Oligoflexia bacterium]|mgnify:CR=1 FL=1|nr:CPBP family intramembrane metalloprotease [Oligoflexia bacterium]HMP47755.1 CPBP family intramembrane metalloprotease [Oligoflexia bacterium]
MLKNKVGEYNKNKALIPQPASTLEIRPLLLISLGFEGFLALAYVLNEYLEDRLYWPRFPTIRELVFGALLALLLFVFNAVLIRVSYYRKEALKANSTEGANLALGWQSITDFVDEYIFPLASRLNIWSALLIALAAGIGEELFFRGLLQPKIGIIAASFLFSLTHFVFELRKYWLLVVLYFLIGLLFGLIYELFDSLWVPVIFHVLYDFCALLYFRFIFPAVHERVRAPV